MYFVESLALRRELGDVPGTATRLSNLALILIHRGEIARALDLLTEAEQLDSAAGDHWGIACDANNLGVAHLLDGHPETGKPLVASALRTFVEFGDDDGVAESLEALAGIAAAEDDAFRTLRLASAADALRQRAPGSHRSGSTASGSTGGSPRPAPSSPPTPSHGRRTKAGK